MINGGGSVHCPLLAYVMLDRTGISMERETYIARSKNIITPPSRKKPPVFVLITLSNSCLERSVRTYPLSRRRLQSLFKKVCISLNSTCMNTAQTYFVNLSATW
jgi:hypothetical protein